MHTYAHTTYMPSSYAYIYHIHIFPYSTNTYVIHYTHTTHAYILHVYIPYSTYIIQVNILHTCPDHIHAYTTYAYSIHMHTLSHEYTTHMHTHTHNFLEPNPIIYLMIKIKYQIDV